jgi:hypothetical protein
LKTDSLFYRLFQTLPSLLFDLLEISIPQVEQYHFRSVELKQTAFRLDGLFCTPENNLELPLFFVEVQFQSEADFYSRFFGEIFLSCFFGATFFVFFFIEFFFDLDICYVAPTPVKHGGGGHMWEGGIRRVGVCVK